MNFHTLPVIMVILIFAGVINAQSIRPIRDNVGFCWNADEMNMLMSYLKNHPEEQTKFSSDNLIGGISPHDDYLYAGKVYFSFYQLINAKEIVMFGVTHGTVRKAMNDPKNVLIFDSYDFWHGPYKNVKVSPLRDVIKNQLSEKYVMNSNNAQDIEHSMEALIPFLQYYNRDIEITPVMVTAMPFERMDNASTELTDIITKYIKEKNYKLGKDIFFLISTDANHYGEDFDNDPYGMNKEGHKEGIENDKRIAHTLFDGTIDEKRIEKIPYELWPNSDSGKPIPIWCGRYPIVFGLMTINKIINQMTGEKLEGKVFKYSDTYTEGVIPLKNTNLGLTAPFSLRHWVGHISAGLYLDGGK